MTHTSKGIVLATMTALACSDSSGPRFTSSGPCDTGFLISSTSPLEAARAMGICDGLTSAAWVLPNGSATGGGSVTIGYGLLPSFGQNNAPREGAALLAISSGSARAPDQAGYSATTQKGYLSPPPAGFPLNPPSCPAVSTTGRDGIGLRVELTVPAGVRQLAFDYAFFSRDYRDYVCSPGLDQAVAIAIGVGGSAAAQNVLLDASGNAMFVSPTSIRACGVAVTGYSCPLGTAPLAGTGFENYGGSGWLRSANLAVTPGQTVTITFAIWDSLDDIVDSTLLLDNFTWIP